MVTLNNSTIIIHNERASLEDKIEIETFIDTLLQEGTRTINLDLSNPVYLPSELLGLLMWKKRELFEEGCSVVITKINPTLKSIFDNARLTEFFEITESSVI